MKKVFILLAVCGLFAVATPALAANGTISGTVTHAADATAINDLYVTIINVDTQAYNSAQTEADGTYSKSVTPGTYTVTTSTSTETEANIYFIAKSATVTVASEETKSGNNFALTRRGRITGHVYAADGVTAISGAGVDLQSTNDTSLGYDSVTANSAGLYITTPQPSDTTVTGVGTYSLVTSKTGYFTASTSVTLVADETTVTQDIRLTAASTVSGIVTDSSGTAIANVNVGITNTDAYFSRSARTDAAGAYTVSVYDNDGYDTSAIGNYTITITKTGYISRTASLTITAESSALTGYNYTLSAAGTITGTVKTSAGVAIRANVYAVNEIGQTCEGTSDASGVYTLTGCYPSTQYTVTATKTNYVTQKKYAITATGGATTSDVNFVLATGQTYSGRVVIKGTNTPIEGATVELTRRNGPRLEYGGYHYYSTLSDGTFIVRSLPSGKYLVKVTKSGYVTSIQESVTITKDVTGAKISLVLGSSITGRLYVGTKTGIGGVVIAVYAINNGKEVNYDSTTTDENGYYLVNGLKNGSYRLRTSSTDYVTKVLSLTIKKANTKVTKNLKLSTAGSISGYITDKVTGLPVSALVRVVGTSITVSSDMNGYYIIDGVAPGKRKIVVISQYYNVPNQKSVTVSAGKVKTGVNVALIPK